MDHIRFEHRPYRIDSDDESEAEGIDTMAMVADYMNFTDANYPRTRKKRVDYVRDAMVHMVNRLGVTRVVPVMVDHNSDVDDDN